MYDKELIIEIFKNIAWSLDQIVKRFQTIKSSDALTFAESDLKSNWEYYKKRFLEGKDEQ